MNPYRSLPLNFYSYPQPVYPQSYSQNYLYPSQQNLANSPKIE